MGYLQRRVPQACSVGPNILWPVTMRAGAAHFPEFPLEFLLPLQQMRLRETTQVSGLHRGTSRGPL